MRERIVADDVCTKTASDEISRDDETSGNRPRDDDKIGGEEKEAIVFVGKSITGGNNETENEEVVDNVGSETVSKTAVEINDTKPIIVDDEGENIATIVGDGSKEIDDCAPDEVIDVEETSETIAAVLDTTNR